MIKPKDILETNKWWKEAVFYQIYPRSFCDSNNDGNGDLPGIISRLDYIKSLGVDAVWLSPVYTSPMADNGYDISDYYSIDSMFGTLADFEELVEGLHDRGIRLMMDLVVNHTSVLHPWFLESRSSRDNPKRDWYIWRDGREGKEPNNWASHFMSSAWEWDPLTKQYYLHLFSKEQPDLNWHNPEVKKAIFQMVRFWLEKGVDAFRMDMANYLMKPAGLPDAPRKMGDTRSFIHGEGLYANQPGMHELIAELRQTVLDKFEVPLFGEMYFLTPQTALEYVASDRQEFDLMYQYEIVGTSGNWTKAKESLRTWYEAFHGQGWNSITLSNHDSPRSVSVFGDDTTFRRESAKCLAAFLFTAPGTPFFLQGEEIGMTNVQFPALDDYSDIEMKSKYAERVAHGEDPVAAFRDLSRWSRDNARTPMQWTDKPNGGFSEAKPWLGVNPNFRELNVANEIADQNSVLNFYKKLIRLRHQEEALVYGDFVPLTPDDWETYAFKRVLGNSEFLVVLNTSPRHWDMDAPTAIQPGNELLLSNYEENIDREGKLVLRPWEARIYRIVATGF